MENSGVIRMKSNGVLYICPTPIGNLDDITIRTLNTLKEVDIIAAEDTRHTIKLLNYFEIKKPLTSYHEHNIKEKGPVLINKLINGENIALVSDAGMPGISDPGEDLIKLAIEHDIKVTALPGATASILALILSGLPTDKFIFEGFLSSNKKDRKERLRKILYEERTMIIYESPHRLLKTLNDMLEILGDRRISIARELTKRYEEIYRANISESINKFNNDTIRGEFVLVVEGSKDINNNEEESFLDLSIKEHIILYIEQGLTKKDAIKKVSKDRNIPKREVYKESLDID